MAEGLRVTGVAETLRALDRELGDNGKVYRQTVRSIKKAGDQAVNRARGYLPQNDEIHPSGFARQNLTRWSGTGTFPRYDRFAATSSIRVIAAREKARMTDRGWRAGRMFGIAIEMRDRAGSIYDVAGNGKSRRQLAKRAASEKSRRFVEQIRRSWTGDPNWRFRVLLPAVVDTRPDIVRDINRILVLAERRLNVERGVWEA